MHIHFQNARRIRKIFRIPQEDFHLPPPHGARQFPRGMASNSLTPDTTELIDWLHAEGLLDLDWDFPATGDLFEAGMDSMAVMQIVSAIEDHYGVELVPEDLTKDNIRTPEKLAELIGSKRS